MNAEYLMSLRIRLSDITVPLISPTVLLTSIITVAGSLQVFAQIAVLTEGGPGTSTTVLVYYLYQQAFQFHFFGYGASLAMLLLLIVGALTYLQWSLRKPLAHAYLINQGCNQAAPAGSR